MRPPVVDQVDFGGQSHHERLEVVHAGPLPARFEPLGEVRDRWAGCLVRRWPTVCAGTRRGGSADSARAGTHWMPLAPVPTRATTLSARASSGSCGSAAGVVVVPARRVERRPGEVLHARDGQAASTGSGSRRRARTSGSRPGRRGRCRRATGRARRATRRGVTPVWKRASSYEVEPVGDRLEVAAGSPRRTRSAAWGRSRALRASGGRCRTRCRT